MRVGMLKLNNNIASNTSIVPVTFCELVELIVNFVFKAY